uniref:Glucose and ribitol dehydrogenase homolog 1-like n=1 Tax=Nelumbo nucifera TaxID=4432 RepID=A0A822XGV4_NELNU|nr:TPA_asm: hypothetical protein HUJ06_020920 [Nelumbo nucifera]
MQLIRGDKKRTASLHNKLTMKAVDPMSMIMFSRAIFSSGVIARSSYYYHTLLSDNVLSCKGSCNISGRYLQYPKKHSIEIIMASGGQQFQPQKQDRQPGKEHAMDPIPNSTSHEYKPSNKLRGKVALVTGGDSGIGRAVCHCFALEGATVAFTYVKGQEDKDADDTLQLIKQANAGDASSKNPMALAADLGYDHNCKRVVEEVVNAYGRIDILVNNAAEQHKANSVEEIGEERLERVFRTNIFAHFFMVRHALNHQRAIVAFTRGLALQLVQKGIRVNGVAPGPVWTPLIPASVSQEQETSQFGTQVPMGRAGQPYEILPSYVFLASQTDSSYITGQVLHPNGGMIVNA